MERSLRMKLRQTIADATDGMTNQEVLRLANEYDLTPRFIYTLMKQRQIPLIKESALEVPIPLEEGALKGNLYFSFGDIGLFDGETPRFIEYHENSDITTIIAIFHDEATAILFYDHWSGFDFTSPYSRDNGKVIYWGFRKEGNVVAFQALS